jgi:hypothetical protein
MVLLGVKAGGAEGQVQLSPYAVPLLGEQTKNSLPCGRAPHGQHTIVTE